MLAKDIARQGPKPVVRHKKVVCSSSHPLVTQTMLQVMRYGGTAVDAGIAGSLLQAVVEPHMTHHAGTVSFLYWEAATGRTYHLNSAGTLVSGLEPFRPVPAVGGMFSLPGQEPCACIPGFMPGLQAIHERFGTRPWRSLCEPAIEAAAEGHVVTSFEFAVLYEELPFFTYFPSGRALFTREGFLPQVGERFKNPELAQTLRRLADEGPEYFTTGAWARHFVAEGNHLGWPVKLEHMTAVPPRWQEPLCWNHNGHEIVQLGPPERTGVFTAFVMGVLDRLGVTSLGRYSQSEETLYYLAHVMRRADFELGLLNDPYLFDVPVERWLSGDFHAACAEIIGGSKPKIDLTEHVRLTSGHPALVAAGMPTAGPGKPQPPLGSCELSIVDEQGNWVQMMNTLQSGGIPGIVVDGVHMTGSHALCTMASNIAGWFTGGGRIRSIIGHTFVMKDGQPWLALGTPGNVSRTIPQVLMNILDFDMDPYAASIEPRMLSLRDDLVLEIESRLPESVVAGLTKLGVRIMPQAPYDWHMGSFQICWRDQESGLLNTCCDPRRVGQAGGI